MFQPRRISTAVALVAGLVFIAAGVPARAQSDSKGLEEVLQEVGQEYATSYLAPLTQSLGANQNSGLYTTSLIPRSKLTFTIGLKAMGTKLADADSAFSKTLSVAALDETFGVNPGDAAYGQSGTVVMSGPTVFGNDGRKGSITAYYQGLPVGTVEGIEGLVDTRWSPLAVPEASIGGIAGLRATVRWLPDIDAGSDVGKIKLFGWGLQYGVTSAMPMVPVDVSVGIFRQSLDFGTVVETEATSLYLAASKQVGVLTLYGGAAKESSKFKVHYTWVETGDRVAFDVDGAQKTRFTLGAALNFGVKLSADANFGSEVTTYAVGFGFGN
jgi:hypothetical protein